MVLVTVSICLEDLVSRQIVLDATQRAELIYLYVLSLGRNIFHRVNSIIIERVRMRRNLNELELGFLNYALGLTYDLLSFEIPCIEILLSAVSHEVIPPLLVRLQFLLQDKPTKVLLQVLVA